MDDLATWLLEQIAEDESRARAACLKGHSAWHNDYGPLGDYDVTDDAGRLIVEEMVNMCNQAEHIARWDPARVLAECDAKRRIIAECRGLSSGVLADDPAAALGDFVLAALALPYADRPGYRAEWSL